MRETQKKGKQGATHPEIPKLSKKTIWKNSADASEINKHSLTFIGYQLLTCPLVLPFKSAFSWFFCAVLFGRESKELYRNNTSIFKEENSVGAVKVNKFWHSLEILWCSDLGTQVKQIAGFSFNACMCPWCWAHNTYKKVLDCLWPTRTTESCMGIKNENLYYCPHHCFSRIIAQMLIWVSRGEKKTRDDMLGIFSHHWQLKNIAFKPREQKEKDGAATDTQTANKFETVSMLTGNVFTYLLKNFKIIQSLFIHKKNETMLWQSLLDIWILIHASFDMITVDLLKTVQGILNVFASKLNIFNLDAGIPAYIHIIIQHTMHMMYKLWKKGLRFSDIDQSSFELSNLVQEHVDAECICQQANLNPISQKYAQKLEKKKMFNIQKFLNFQELTTNSEGKAKYCKLFKCCQIMLHFCRRLILCSTYGQNIAEMPDMDRKHHANTKASLNENAKRQEVKEVLARNKCKMIDDELFQHIINQEPEQDPQPVYETFQDLLDEREAETDLAELPDNIVRLLVSEIHQNEQNEHNKEENEENEQNDQENEQNDQENEQNDQENQQNDQENQQTDQENEQNPQENEQNQQENEENLMNSSQQDEHFIPFQNDSFSEHEHDNENQNQNEHEYFNENEQEHENQNEHANENESESDEEDIFNENEQNDDMERQNEELLNDQNDSFAAIFSKNDEELEERSSLFDEHNAQNESYLRIPTSNKRKPSTNQISFSPQTKKKRIHETLTQLSNTHNLTQRQFASDNFEVVDERKQINYSNFDATNLFGRMSWMKQ